MPVTIATREDRSQRSGRDAITIGFVNNMPDSAFLATERQFIGLIEAGSGDAIRVIVIRCALRSVPHGSEIAQLIDEHYCDVDALWRHRPDALIVTGAEPLATALTDELYWSELAELLTRADAEIPSVLLSCLAAHAALYLFDGAERTLLAAKCSGVFAQDRVALHRLTEGLPESLVFPHSRLNDVPTEAVRAACYEILIASRDASWTVISRPSRAGELVLVQGHPEYDAMTMLREYRRDVMRYLTGTRPGLPVLPSRCVAIEDEPTMTSFHARVTSETPKPELITVLPFDELVKRAEWPWRSAAIRFYTNWITDISRRVVDPQRALSP